MMIADWHPLFTIYLTISALLLLYGLNSYLIIAMFLRRRKRAQAADHALEQAFWQSPLALPNVTTQIPVYNEVNVVERILRACAAINYPPEKHLIQVLDDSNDETATVIDRVAEELRATGVRIEVVRRAHRGGFKAGALRDGLALTADPFVAIFDADFVPPKDFLRRTLPHLLVNPELGLVQTRWGHLNQGKNWLTRAFAIGIDGHFAVEQPARAWNQLFLNFNGTAGLWRREAIDEGGGWQADTLTEDMDLSYRCQLVGWKIHFLADCVVPAEIPENFTALKSQQFRWAKGSTQTALKLLPRIWRSPVGCFRKIEATLHLTHYFIHPCMFLIGVLALPILLVQAPTVSPLLWVAASIPIVLAALGPSSLYLVSQWSLDPRRWWRQLLQLPALLVVGFGISFSNTRAVFEAIIGRNSPFVRTPKAGEHTLKRYQLPFPLTSVIETGLGLYCLTTLVLAFAFHRPSLGPFLLIYALGFSVVGLSSLADRWKTA